MSSHGQILFVQEVDFCCQLLDPENGDHARREFLGFEDFVLGSPREIKRVGTGCFKVSCFMRHSFAMLPANCINSTNLFGPSCWTSNV